MGIWFLGLGLLVFVIGSALMLDGINRLAPYRTDILPHQSPSSGSAWTAQGNYMRSENYTVEGRVRLRVLHLSTFYQLLGPGLIVVGMALGADESLNSTPFADWIAALGSVWAGAGGYLLAAALMTTSYFAVWSGAGWRTPKGVPRLLEPPSWTRPVLVVEALLMLAFFGWLIWR